MNTYDYIPMHFYKTLFHTIEFTSFILPALPSSLNVRICILLIYFIAHYYKLQFEYLKLKNKYIAME